MSFEVLCFCIFCQNQEYCTSCKQCLSFLHRTSLLQIQEGTVCISCIPHLKLGYTGVFHIRHHDNESKACMPSYETRERRMYLPCIVCSAWLHFEDKRMNVPQDIFGRDKWFEASDVLQFYSATKMQNKKVKIITDKKFTVTFALITVLNRLKVRTISTTC